MTDFRILLDDAWKCAEAAAQCRESGDFENATRQSDARRLLIRAAAVEAIKAGMTAEKVLKLAVAFEGVIDSPKVSTPALVEAYFDTAILIELYENGDFSGPGWFIKHALEATAA